ncbi:MAG: sigma-E processing peptidase SpoIIGA [Clostridiales bacterium]|nr:sigma-E processing peptidase SpoIIGA [Clostridiales bacterium]
MRAALLELALDALMIALALRLGGWRIRPARVLVGAVLGTMASAALGGLPRALQAAMWLPVALAMMRAADGPAPVWLALRRAALLLCAAGLIGGTLLALLGAAGSPAAAYGIALAAVIAMACATGRARRSAAAMPQRLRIRCAFRGREITLHAIADSGNTLRDYLTHKPVVVLPQAAGQRLGLGGAALRPIFADTAGGRQMMACFTPQVLEALADGKRRTLSAVVALSPGLGADAPALVPAALLADKEESTGRRGIPYGKETDKPGNGGMAGLKAAAFDHPAGGFSRVHRRK